MPIRLPANLPGKGLGAGFTFKIEVMLSGVPSRAKAGTERSRSIPWQHRRRPGVRRAFRGILRLRAAPPPPSRRLLRMTSDFVKQPDKQAKTRATLRESHIFSAAFSISSAPLRFQHSAFAARFEKRQPVSAAWFPSAGACPKTAPRTAPACAACEFSSRDGNRPACPAARPTGGR